jgi:hypothetical protein
MCEAVLCYSHRSFPQSAQTRAFPATRKHTCVCAADVCAYTTQPRHEAKSHVGQKTSSRKSLVFILTQTNKSLDACDVVHESQIMQEFIQ